MTNFFFIKDLLSQFTSAEKSGIPASRHVDNQYAPHGLTIAKEGIEVEEAKVDKEMENHVITSSKRLSGEVKINFGSRDVAVPSF